MQWGIKQRNQNSYKGEARKMAHLGFITLAVMGHLYPMSTLALHLMKRGHRVTFFSIADAEAFITGAGLACVVLGREEFPLGYMPRVLDELSRMNGARGLRYTIKLLCADVRVTMDEVPAAIKDAGIDALVIDQFFMGGNTVADHQRSARRRSAHRVDKDRQGPSAQQT
jgi:zeaxanthin glucosyltransferase